MSETLNEAARGGGFVNSGRIVNQPDPSAATTQAILREISNLKEVTSVEIASLRRAVDLDHEDRVRWPTTLERSVKAFADLYDSKLETHAEMFRGIEKQFIERDVRSDQTTRDSSKAIDAALLAQKSAVAEQQLSNDKATTKSEATTNKLLDQQAQLLKVTEAGLNVRIDSLKENLATINTTLASLNAAMAGRTEHIRDVRAETKEGREGLSIWFAAISVILTIIGVSLAIVASR